MGRREPPRVKLCTAHKIVDIIATAVYSKIRTRTGLRITRTGVFDTLPAAGGVLLSAGAVTPENAFTTIINDDTITAIIVGLQEGTAVLCQIIELLFFCQFCHNNDAELLLPPGLSCYCFLFSFAKVMVKYYHTKYIRQKNR